MTRKIYFCFGILFSAMLLLCFFSGCKASLTPLANVENVRVEKRVLCWDEVENATGYVVRIGNEEFEIEENRFPLYSLTAEGGDVIIDIMAIGDQKKFDDSSWYRINESFEAVPEEGYDDEQFRFILLPDKSGYALSRGFADLEGVITLPAFYCDYPVKHIAEYAFSDSSDSSYKRDPFIGYMVNGFTTQVILPDTLECIEQEAFACMIRLEKVVIPNSVKTIGSCAFYGCINLTSVTLPDGLVEIPNGCFAETALSEIVFPQTLERIGDYAFRCSYVDVYDPDLCVNGHVYSDLATVNLPSSLTQIGLAAFRGRESLTEIVCSNNIQWLDPLAFYETAWYTAQPEGFISLGVVLYCYKGEIPTSTVEIPSHIKILGGGCFSGQNNLQFIHIPNGVSFGGRGVFADCENLKEIVLPNDLEYIPELTFNKTLSLTEITFPDSVIRIGTRAFARSGLESVTIGASVKEIEKEAFESCENLRCVYICDGTELIIRDSAFGYCSNLSQIRFPNTRCEIERENFKRCAVQELVIPASVCKLAQTSFDSCNSLTRVYFEGTTEQMDQLTQDYTKAPFSNAIIYYLSEHSPTRVGNFWHYVDGVPTVW